MKYCDSGSDFHFCHTIESTHCIGINLLLASLYILETQTANCSWQTHITRSLQGIDGADSLHFLTVPSLLQASLEGHSSCRVLPTTHLCWVLFRDPECSGVWWQSGAQRSLLSRAVHTIRWTEAVTHCWQRPSSAHAQLRGKGAHVCLRKVVT